MNENGTWYCVRWLWHAPCGYLFSMETLRNAGVERRTNGIKNHKILSWFDHVSLFSIHTLSWQQFVAIKMRTLAPCIRLLISLFTKDEKNAQTATNRRIYRTQNIKPQAGGIEQRGKNTHIAFSFWFIGRWIPIRINALKNRISYATRYPLVIWVYWNFLLKDRLPALSLAIIRSNWYFANVMWPR